MANWPRRTQSVSVDHDLLMPMRDGIRLRADVLRPSGIGPVPVVLLRTPYDRQLGSAFGLQINAMQLAAAGYAVVVQDVRGRFGSEGDFYPFVNEANDGVDSIAWCAEQSWSNGRVGMAGSSYLGFSQVLAAQECPDALKAWAPAMTTVDARSAWVYEGDAFCLGFDLSWGAMMMAGDPRTRDITAAHQILQSWQMASRIPIAQNPLFEQPSGQFMRDWIERKDDTAYWSRQRGDGVGVCSAPALQIGGWYDLFHSGTFRLHDTLANGEAGSAHRFVVGPWDHSGLPFGTGSGDVDFGPHAAFDLGSVQREWFDWLLYEESEPDWPRNRLFITGANVWESFDVWPPESATVEFFLGADGRLNDVATDTGEVRFEADPDDPTPTVGGRLCCSLYLLPVGSRRQDSRANRADVVRFQTEPVSISQPLLGRVTADIWSTSDREQGDVHLTLVDIDPHGHSQYLADGIARGTLLPGEPTRFAVDLGQIGHVLQPEHRLGLDIAAMSFPRFDPNPVDGAQQRSIVYGGAWQSILRIG